jgi:iron-sulfur cluster repair protein YtfE (RIC family)
VKLLDEGIPNPRGDALLQELQWIHSVIRDQLAAIGALVAQVQGGAAAEDVHAQIDGLARTSIIWTLRVSCMRSCSLIHGHHHHEDAAWFPALRRANPAIGSVIDTLEADHRLVSRLLDSVEQAAARLDADQEARAALAAALDALAEHLLRHLDYEEANLAPTLRRLSV